MRLDQDFDGATNGTWNAATDINTGSTLYHVAVTYDNSSINNDPVFYLNAAVDTTTETDTPAGSAVSDAASALICGEDGGGSSDFDGQINWLNYDNTIWTQAQVNRAMWWGTPGGSRQVFHPWVTDSVLNHGSAVANGTVTGSVMGASIPRVERMWGAMLGVGR